jgi:hypothetical protein
MGRGWRAPFIARMLLTCGDDRAFEEGCADPARRARRGHDDLHRQGDAKEQLEEAATAHLEFVRYSRSGRFC